MKKILALVSLIALGGVTFGKTIDQSAAQTVAYNFYKTVANIQAADDLSLVYKATSVINNAEVVDFYVFNNTASKGFVIVSADDNIMPVLAYSSRSSFGADNIPSNVSSWLQGYQNSIARAIQNNLSTGADVAEKWSSLRSPSTLHIAAKTTGIVVYPLIQSLWDQGQFFDSLCPYDTYHHARCITGCVATAMAQVMRYWQWPDTATGGSHSYMPYTESYLGTLTVNFSNSVYKWNAMAFPANVLVQSPNMSVAKLMYDAGVSVNMDYTYNNSGSYVISAQSPVQNCAQYALKTYFRYKPTITGIIRNGNSDAQWIQKLQDELAANRPVIYSGFGPQGGHCFVCDGYDQNDYFDFNWGWSSAYNGYYTVNSLAPGTDTFNDNQAALINIIPDTPVVIPAFVQPLAQNSDIKIYPNPANNVINISASATEISDIYITDVMGQLVLKSAATKGGDIISLPLTNMASGTYFIQLNTDKGIKTQKIIVAK